MFYWVLSVDSVNTNFRTNKNNKKKNVLTSRIVEHLVSRPIHLTRNVPIDLYPARKNILGTWNCLPRDSAKYNNILLLRFRPFDLFGFGINHVVVGRIILFVCLFIFFFYLYIIVFFLSLFRCTKIVYVPNAM